MIATLALAAAVCSGRDNQLHVTIPRGDTPAATITVHTSWTNPRGRWA
jgi:hypothetical protein